MKLFCLLFLTTIFATAQTKKIDFFGTEFLVNNSCAYKPDESISTLKYGKNAMMWSQAPPSLLRGILLSTLRSKIKEKKVKEIKSEELKLSMLKSSWTGKMTQFQKKGNDTISNLVSLIGDYKNEERMLIFIYKTPKQEPFRIPTYFDFLIK
jgi:hypothetical protein